MDDDENPLTPNGIPKPRDSLSRASRLAKRIQCLLAENRSFWLSGRCLGLRVYGLEIADTINTLVAKSEIAGPAEFDTYHELVGFLAEELEAVMNEILGA